MKKIKKIGCWLGIIFLVWSIGSVIILRFIPVPLTYLMLNQYFAVGKLDKQWQNLDHLSVNMPLAIVAAEDQKFARHHGFDTASIARAWQYNSANTNKLRGASTISQQTAKNVFLWPQRSWLRKGLESYFTLLIELLWPKTRILEVYLNVAEFGPGIFGAEAAAKHYFNISAAQLSAEQAAILAALLPNPRKYSQQIYSPPIQHRKNWILRQMKNLKTWS